MSCPACDRYDDSVAIVRGDKVDPDAVTQHYEEHRAKSYLANRALLALMQAKAPAKLIKDAEEFLHFVMNTGD